VIFHDGPGPRCEAEGSRAEARAVEQQVKIRMHEKVCTVLEERVISVRTIEDLVRAYTSATLPDSGSQMTDDSRADSRTNLGRTGRKRS
jgi:hypothetical protein